MKKWLFLIVVFTVISFFFGKAWKKHLMTQTLNSKGGPGQGAMTPGGNKQGGKPGGPGGPGGGMPVSVELAPVVTRDILTSFEATGNVESMEDVKISPRVSGRIDMLKVREGDRVKKDQVLVKLDASDVKANVRQQEAALAEAKFRLTQAQLNQTPTDTAIATQIRQQEANLSSSVSDQTQAEKTRDAQLEASKATLDDAQAKIDTATAAVANANANLKSAQANLDNATAKYNRIYGLYKQGYVAAQDVDDAKTTVSVQQAAVDTAKGQIQSATAALNSAMAQKRNTEQQANITRAKVDADLESAKAKVTQARASLDAAKANAQQSPAYQQNLAALRESVNVAQATLDSAKAKVADTVLKSPIDGVVTARAQDQGEMASPGQAILTVQSLNDIWVSIAVPDDVSTKVHLSQPATIVFDALGGKTFDGRIAQINPSADAQSRQFTVRVALDNRRRLFSPGMFGRVTMTTGEVKGTLAVPREAVQQDPDGSSFVIVAKGAPKGPGKGAAGVGAKPAGGGAPADGGKAPGGAGKGGPPLLTAVKCPIEINIQDADWVGIASGVNKGDQVVTMSANPVRDGQKLRASGGRQKSADSAAGQAGGRRGHGKPGAPGARQQGGKPGSGGDGAAPPADTTQPGASNGGAHGAPAGGAAPHGHRPGAPHGAPSGDGANPADTSAPGAHHHTRN